MITARLMTASLLGILATVQAVAPKYACGHVRCVALAPDCGACRAALCGVARTCPRDRAGW